MSVEFLLTVFIVCLAPGIGVVYTLSTTLGGGLRAGMLATLGCTLATAVHLSVAMAGLAAALHSSALLFQTIKWAGVLFLLWMAWGTLRSTGTLDVKPDTPRAGLTIIWHGIMLNLLNPKLPMFFLAFLPQFIAADAPDATAQLITLGLAFVAVTYAVFTLYSLLAGTMRRKVLSSPRAMTWLRRAFAATFAALGARLAVESA